MKRYNLKAKVEFTFSSVSKNCKWHEDVIKSCITGLGGSKAKISVRRACTALVKHKTKTTNKTKQTNENTTKSS